MFNPTRNIFDNILNQGLNKEVDMPSIRMGIQDGETLAGQPVLVYEQYKFPQGKPLVSMKDFEAWEKAGMKFTGKTLQVQDEAEGEYYFGGVSEC